MEVEELKKYLNDRLKTIGQAIMILDDNAFLKGEYLAFESILRKLEELEKWKKMNWKN